MNLVMDFALHSWRTLGPTLLIMTGVVIAYAAGKDKWPWGMLLSGIIIGISCGWLSHVAEVRGKEKLLTALIEARQPEQAGGE